MNVTFSIFTNPYFHDWETKDYTSYVHTFFHIMEDNMFWMDSPYVEVYMNNEGDDTYDAVYPEVSCLAQFAWDWSESN